MLKVLMRKNETGEEKLLEIDLEWYSDFIWTEGNFACDCNRHSFFEEYKGDEDDEDFPCGGSAYTIPFIILDDGKKVEIDG